MVFHVEGIAARLHCSDLVDEWDNEFIDIDMRNARKVKKLFKVMKPLDLTRLQDQFARRI